MGFDHRVFASLWRRLLLTTFLFGWGIFELLAESPIWAIVFIGASLYSGWHLLLRYPKSGGD